MLLCCGGVGLGLVGAGNSAVEGMHLLKLPGSHLGTTSILFSIALAYERWDAAMDYELRIHDTYMLFRLVDASPEIEVETPTMNPVILHACRIADFIRFSFTFG
jgi:hypothetical protein